MTPILPDTIRPHDLDFSGLLCKRNRMRAATIKDVAHRAGVSTATVSRVLNNSGYFDPETARAVNEAVKTLDYRRNVHWKRLSSNSSETICFLLGNRDALNSMQVKMLMAAERELTDAGFDLVFAPFRYSPNTAPERLQLPRLIAQQGTVDGVILAGLHYENFLDALSNINLPYVVLGNTYIGHQDKIKTDALVYDDITGAYEATKYLLRLGHRRIAFVGDTNLPWFGRRYEGYRRALGENNIEEIRATEDWGVGYIEYGKLAASELLRDANPPTAVFAANDEIAGGVWKTLANRGIRIPEEISLMGFGDREDFSILEPSLTTVTVFQEKIGAELAGMLLRKLQNPEVPLDSRTFPCQIVERNSCAAPRSQKKLVLA